MRCDVWGVRSERGEPKGTWYSFVEYEKLKVDMIDDETRQRVGLLKLEGELIS
jgi:hypothetical protein